VPLSDGLHPSGEVGLCAVECGVGPPTLRRKSVRSGLSLARQSVRVLAAVHTRWQPDPSGWGAHFGDSALMPDETSVGSGAQVAKL
jgi:hypothetical protein